MRGIIRTIKFILFTELCNGTPVLINFNKVYTLVWLILAEEIHAS